ncbi:hypothetical protein QYE76_011242 [Lolium multiflorum]|uniref:Uncharacterized protein n=1 Tax=Lolium multiflorum TaxID=4521 RepID=A0AAD8TYU1_LOLMU|nr:hypothetical protein QYE76_011242 [Lolium multiflorum]
MFTRRRPSGGDDVSGTLTSLDESNGALNRRLEEAIGGGRGMWPRRCNHFSVCRARLCGLRCGSRRPLSVLFIPEEAAAWASPGLGFSGEEAAGLGFSGGLTAC